MISIFVIEAGSAPDQGAANGLYCAPGPREVRPGLGCRRPLQGGELTRHEEQRAAVRSHRCEVTASWCSPRTVCTSAAALAKAAARRPVTGVTASAA